MNPATSAEPIVLGAVILAAGRSVRMGQPKLLLPWGGTSVLGHLIASWHALGCSQLAVVAASDDSRLQAELDRLQFPAHDRIFNPLPERGMFSSIQEAARWPGWDGALTHWAIALGDQPHLRLEMLRALVDFSAAHPRQICQPAHGGHGRHPVILPRPDFLQLATAPAANFKAFLANSTIALLQADDPGLDLDIDRPEDYERALKVGSVKRET